MLMAGRCPSVMELGGYTFPDLKHLTPGMGGSILLTVNTYIVSIWSLWALFSMLYIYYCPHFPGEELRPAEVLSSDL